jgi:hypothetical protein
VVIVSACLSLPIALDAINPAELSQPVRQTKTGSSGDHEGVTKKAGPCVWGDEGVALPFFWYASALNIRSALRYPGTSTQLKFKNQISC